jgi:hypothetical protein
VSVIIAASNMAIIVALFTIKPTCIYAR